MKKSDEKDKKKDKPKNVESHPNVAPAAVGGHDLNFFVTEQSAGFIKKLEEAGKDDTRDKKIQLSRSKLLHHNPTEKVSQHGQLSSKSQTQSLEVSEPNKMTIRDKSYEVESVIHPEKKDLAKNESSPRPTSLLSTSRTIVRGDKRSGDAPSFGPTATMRRKSIEVDAIEMSKRSKLNVEDLGSGTKETHSREAFVPGVGRQPPIIARRKSILDDANVWKQMERRLSIKVDKEEDLKPKLQLQRAHSVEDREKQRRHTITSDDLDIIDKLRSTPIVKELSDIDEKIRIEKVHPLPKSEKPVHTSENSVREERLKRLLFPVDDGTIPEPIKQSTSKPILKSQETIGKSKLTSKSQDKFPQAQKPPLPQLHPQKSTPAQDLGKLITKPASKTVTFVEGTKQSVQAPKEQPQLSKNATPIVLEKSKAAPVVPVAVTFPPAKQISGLPAVALNQPEIRKVIPVVENSLKIPQIPELSKPTDLPHILGKPMISTAERAKPISKPLDSPKTPTEIPKAATTANPQVDNIKPPTEALKLPQTSPGDFELGVKSPTRSSPQMNEVKQTSPTTKPLPQPMVPIKEVKPTSLPIPITPQPDLQRQKLTPLPEPGKIISEMPNFQSDPSKQIPKSSNALPKIDTIKEVQEAPETASKRKYLVDNVKPPGDITKISPSVGSEKSISKIEPPGKSLSFPPSPSVVVPNNKEVKSTNLLAPTVPNGQTPPPALQPPNPTLTKDSGKVITLVPGDSSKPIPSQPDAPTKPQTVKLVSKVSEVASKQKYVTENLKTPADIQKPPADIPKPPADILKPPSDISKSPADIPKPPADIPKPPSDISKPPADIPKPPADIPKPPADIPKPPSDIPKPPADIPKPPADIQKSPVSSDFGEKLLSTQTSTSKKSEVKSAISTTTKPSSPTPPQPLLAVGHVVPTKETKPTSPTEPPLPKDQTLVQQQKPTPAQESGKAIVGISGRDFEASKPIPKPPDFSPKFETPKVAPQALEAASKPKSLADNVKPPGDIPKLPLSDNLELDVKSRKSESDPLKKSEVKSINTTSKSLPQTVPLPPPLTGIIPEVSAKEVKPNSLTPIPPKDQNPIPPIQPQKLTPSHERGKITTQPVTKPVSVEEGSKHLIQVPNELASDLQTATPIVHEKLKEAPTVPVPPSSTPSPALVVNLQIPKVVSVTVNSPKDLQLPVKAAIPHPEPSKPIPKSPDPSPKSEIPKEVPKEIEAASKLMDNLKPPTDNLKLPQILAEGLNVKSKSASKTDPRKNSETKTSPTTKVPPPQQPPLAVTIVPELPIKEVKLANLRIPSLPKDQAPMPPLQQKKSTPAAEPGKVVAAEVPFVVSEPPKSISKQPDLSTKVGTPNEVLKSPEASSKAKSLVDNVKPATSGELSEKLGPKTEIYLKKSEVMPTPPVAAAPKSQVPSPAPPVAAAPKSQVPSPAPPVAASPKSQVPSPAPPVAASPKSQVPSPAPPVAAAPKSQVPSPAPPVAASPKSQVPSPAPILQLKKSIHPEEPGKFIAAIPVVKSDPSKPIPQLPDDSFLVRPKTPDVPKVDEAESKPASLVESLKALFRLPQKSSESSSTPKPPSQIGLYDFGFGVGVKSSYKSTPSKVSEPVPPPPPPPLPPPPSPPILKKPSQSQAPVVQVLHKLPADTAEEPSSNTTAVSQIKAKETSPKHIDTGTLMQILRARDLLKRKLQKDDILDLTGFDLPNQKPLLKSLLESDYVPFDFGGLIRDYYSHVLKSPCLLNMQDRYRGIDYESNCLEAINVSEVGSKDEHNYKEQFRKLAFREKLLESLGTVSVDSVHFQYLNDLANDQVVTLPLTVLHGIITDVVPVFAEIYQYYKKFLGATHPSTLEAGRHYIKMKNRLKMYDTM